MKREKGNKAYLSAGDTTLLQTARSPHAPFQYLLHLAHTPCPSLAPSLIHSHVLCPIHLRFLSHFLAFSAPFIHIHTHIMSPCQAHGQ